LERTFKPNHINATIEDLQGNNGIGTFFYLVQMAEQEKFQNYLKMSES